MKIDHNDNNYTPIIADNNVIIFDTFTQWEWERTITIPADTHCIYVCLCKNTVNLTITLQTWWEKATCDISFLALCNSWNSITAKIVSNLDHSYSQSNIHMVSLYWSDSHAAIEWSIVMKAWTQKLEGYLLEENIILWENITLKTLPMLDVQSNDVKASHWARIQRLDKQNLFYLQSKWLSSKQAQELMIWWYIETMLSPLKDEVLINAHKKESLVYILQ